MNLTRFVHWLHTLPAAGRFAWISVICGERRGCPADGIRKEEEKECCPLITRMGANEEGNVSPFDQRGYGFAASGGEAVRELGVDGAVVYDVKSVLPPEFSDLRL